MGKSHSKTWRSYFEVSELLYMTIKQTGITSLKLSLIYGKFLLDWFLLISSCSHPVSCNNSYCHFQLWLDPTTCLFLLWLTSCTKVCYLQFEEGRPNTLVSHIRSSFPILFNNYTGLSCISLFHFMSFHWLSQSLCTRGSYLSTSLLIILSFDSSWRTKQSLKSLTLDEDMLKLRGTDRKLSEHKRPTFCIVLNNMTCSNQYIESFSTT